MYVYNVNNSGNSRMYILQDFLHTMSFISEKESDNGPTFIIVLLLLPPSALTPLCLILYYTYFFAYTV